MAEAFDDRDPSYCTPSGSALAATWDADMVRRVGELVGRDARRKDLDVVLGPTVNLHRSPLGGRGFECYSEDPLLTAEIAVGWVAGVQGQGVAATAKHFVANESETSRMTADMVVDERALRELYLAPFEALAAAGVWAIMTAYNKVNGTYASEHAELVGAILKGEWGVGRSRDVGLVWDQRHESVCRGGPGSGDARSWPFLRSRPRDGDRRWDSRRVGSRRQGKTLGSTRLAGRGAGGLARPPCLRRSRRRQRASRVAGGSSVRQWCCYATRANSCPWPDPS